MYQTASPSQQTAAPVAPVIQLPRPSARHATCAWCGDEFSTIVALIDHVDSAHVADSRLSA